MSNNKNFWGNLPKPFHILAPMADVTDPPFRTIIAKYGKPDVLYTQFISCDGLCSEGYDVLIREFSYSEKERPIVAQIFGAKPENFYESAKMIKALGFDGVDINMGCPDKHVMKQCAGASLMSNPSLAKEIILATKEGASGMPVSVKTRVGDSEDELDSWVPTLLSAKPDMITMHARTRKQMSKVPANWRYVAKTVELAKNTDTLIVGNGDVLSLSDGKRLAEESGADGIMYGRAIFGNPWFFNEKFIEKPVNLIERLTVLAEHTKVFEDFYKPRKNFANMKKHFKAYVDGFPHAKELRVELMNTNCADEVTQIIQNFIKKLT